MHGRRDQAQDLAEDIAALRKELLDAVIELDDKTKTLAGCADRFCYITGRRTGMVTNGGCRCLYRPSDETLRSVRKRAHWISDFREKILKLALEGGT